MTRFVALTGLPRSGSTLCCHLVAASPDAVALVEPMDVMVLDPHDHERAGDQILAFFRESEASLRERGLAESVHAEGVLPDNPYGTARSSDGLRERRVSEVAPIRFEKALSAEFLLLVKHNAAFAALLPTLRKRVEVFALMRNPLAVLCSWQTVPIPPQRGHAIAAEHFDGALRSRLAAEPEVLERQILLLDWFFRQYRDHVPLSNRLRYEAIVHTDGRELRDRLGLADPADARTMRERNANAAYLGVDIDRLASRLLASDGAWDMAYSRTEIQALAERLSASR